LTSDLNGARSELDRVVVDDVSAPGAHMVRLYLLGLTSDQSKASMDASLKAVARLVAEAGGLPIPAELITAGAIDWSRLDFASATAVRQLMDSAWAPATINRHVSAIRGVVRTCRLAGMIDAERANAIREALRNARKEYEGADPAARLVTDGELRTMFVELAAQNDVTACRDAAMLAVLAAGGVRRSELVGFDLADWDPSTSALLVRHGKGGKRRNMWLHAGAIDAIDAWLEVRGDADGPLFVQVLKSGRIPFHTVADRDPEDFRLSSHTVWRRLRRLANASSVKLFGPHDMRRKVATDLLDSGADLNAVRILLGHSSIATTTIYDRRGERAAQSVSSRLIVPYVRPVAAFA
jgi:site-specific recombinase XerD